MEIMGTASVNPNIRNILACSIGTNSGCRAAPSKNLLPKIANVSNPLDYTTPIWGFPEKTYPVFIEAIKRSKAGTAILVQDYPAPGLEDSKISYLNDAKAFIEASARLKISSAICSTFPENLTEEIRSLSISNKVAPMQGLRETLIAIKSTAEIKTLAKQIKLSEIKDLYTPKRTQSTTVLNEVKSKKILDANNIATPKGKICGAAQVMKSNLNYPLVLKYITQQRRISSSLCKVYLIPKQSCRKRRYLIRFVVEKGGG